MYGGDEVILAVSTTAVNPLQALQDLHARLPDFPSWIDSTHLRYSLIVHPSHSPLTNPMYVATYIISYSSLGILNP